MIKVGILGATGYAGQEIVRLLLNHKEAEVVWFGSQSYIDKQYAKVFGNMFRLVEDVCKADNIEELANEVDVIFTATPQGFCSSIITEEVLSKVKVIDLSADFRIKDVETYEHWYGITHKSPSYIEEAVYGLCEINREQVKKARLVANPGCYPTCSFLTIYPLAKEGLIDMKSIIIDAKSGTSGAGRGAKVNNLYCEVNENIKAYGVGNHRHTPEIEEQLTYASGEQALINFTPHLVPMNRGILITAYGNLKKKVSYEEVKAITGKDLYTHPIIVETYLDTYLQKHIDLIQNDKIISFTEVVSVDKIGQPKQIASSITTGAASCNDGINNKSACLIYG